MATQKFEDGSLEMVNNAMTSEEIQQKYELIREALHRLTHPDKIIEMTKQMEEQGLLTKKDVEKLKGKGVITLEQTHDMQPQKQQEEIDREEDDEIR